MDNDQNWYRQLMALVLLSASKAAVEFIKNPSSREDTTNHLRGAFAEIDYEALASALTKTIDTMATESKGRLNEAIDTLRDRAEDAVDEAKTRAEKQLGSKKKGGKLKWVFILGIAGLLAYFIMDEQRRDDMMDRLTGASGPVQPSTQTFGQGAGNATKHTNDVVQQAAQTAENAASQSKDVGHEPKPATES